MGGKQRTSLFITSEEEERRMGRATAEAAQGSAQQDKQGKGGGKR